MTTANDLITGALRAISAVTPGEPVDGTEAGNALTVLNRMLKSWSAKSLMIPYRTLESFTWTAGQSSYTIGQSGTPSYNTLRPDTVTYVYRRQNGLDTPLVSMTKDEYNSITDKSVSGVADYFYYDPQSPNGVMYLYQVPSKNLTIFMESLKPVNQFTTLLTDITLPGEYEEAIVYLLAHRLSIEYGVTLSQELVALIKDAEQFIRRRNAKQVVATFDRALNRTNNYNIDSGSSW